VFPISKKAIGVKRISYKKPFPSLEELFGPTKVEAMGSILHLLRILEKVGSALHPLYLHSSPFSSIRKLPLITCCSLLTKEIKHLVGD
jgi:hypothetical protein